MVETLVFTGTPDDELVAAARLGDADALGSLWGRHQAVAMRVARRLTDAVTAEDLVSEAFLRVHAALRAGGGPTGAFRSYLLSTVRNLHTDILRSRQNATILVEQTRDLESLMEPVRTVDGGTRALAKDAFLRLREKDRMVLTLTLMFNFDVNAVATEMNIPVEVVPMLSHRARENLRQSFILCHLRPAGSAGCAAHVAKMAVYFRGSMPSGKRLALEAHIEACTSCSNSFAEAGRLSMEMSRAGHRRPKRLVDRLATRTSAA